MVSVSMNSNQNDAFHFVKKGLYYTQTAITPTIFKEVTLMYQIDFNKPIHVHFIGIGGISMSALARLLVTRGFTVSGSDWHESDLTRELEALGVRIFLGQHTENIVKEIDLVVYTAAVQEDNEEFLAAKALSIPMMTRAVLLGQIMKQFPHSVGIAGTHGKTTTTSILSALLLAGKLDPTISVGGVLDLIGGNLRIGASDYFVTEACEYTNSFLSLYPTDVIILNIEEDHLDFFKTLRISAVLLPGMPLWFRQTVLLTLMQKSKSTLLYLLTPPVPLPPMALLKERSTLKTRPLHILMQLPTSLMTAMAAVPMILLQITNFSEEYNLDLSVVTMFPIPCRPLPWH